MLFSDFVHLSLLWYDTGSLRTWGLPQVYTEDKSLWESVCTVSYVCKCVHVYISSGITRLKDRRVCILYMPFHAYACACMSRHIRSLRDWSVCDVALTWVPEYVYWIHECSCGLWLRLGRDSKAPQIGKYALIHSQLHPVSLPISLCGYTFWSLFVCFSCLPSFSPRAKTRPGCSCERASARDKGCGGEKKSENLKLCPLREMRQ